jgi:hypothetical protein
MEGRDMTEKRVREISIEALARMFAGNEQPIVEHVNDSARVFHTPITDGWMGTLLGAARRGELQVTRQEGWHRYTSSSAVAAWLSTLPEQATKDIHSHGWIWLGVGEHWKTPVPALNKAVSWWETEYDILELAQQFGEELMAKTGKAGQNDVAKKVASHITNKEARKTTIGQKARSISTTSLKKGPMKGWKYKAD